MISGVLDNIRQLIVVVLAANAFVMLFFTTGCVPHGYRISEVAEGPLRSPQFYDSIWPHILYSNVTVVSAVFHGERIFPQGLSLSFTVCKRGHTPSPE